MRNKSHEQFYHRLRENLNSRLYFTKGLSKTGVQPAAHIPDKEIWIVRHPTSGVLLYKDMDDRNPKRFTSLYALCQYANISAYRKD